ncbi:Uridine nucleosidase 1 [Microbotryomycetes sp. JL201]|nr:Uridine nucleosidase 1 [Microbotryomycetes sp. JL201]
MSARKQVWLDADPGHDDAIAILLALHLPHIELVGLSTVHGNTSVENATGKFPQVCQDVSLMTEIHGKDGLAGVLGLPDPDHPSVQTMVTRARALNVVESMAQAARSRHTGHAKLTIVATGALTNVALFVATYPDLVRDNIEQIVLMGGAEGRGNMAPTAEFNILIDPEAAQMVFDADVPVVMIPLNVTHTNIYTTRQSEILEGSTPLRRMLSTVLEYFRYSYEVVFGFKTGPPVHDPLCLFFVTSPGSFEGKRYRVDVELAGQHTAGTTVIDLYNFRELPQDGLWGKEGRNVWVAETADIDQFWIVFHEIKSRP